MKIFAKTLFLFFFLSISSAIISMEKSVSDEPIEEIKPLVDLGLPHEIWAIILEQVYLDSSIFNNAQDIDEAIDIIEQHFKKCYFIISLVCKSFKDLNISKEQWDEFKRKTRQLYIPYLNERFLETRRHKEGLYPKNSNWDCCDQSTNKGIAQFLATRVILNATLLSNLIEEDYINPNLNLLKLLLFYGFDVNTKDRTDHTTLSRLMSNPANSNAIDIVALLLDYQANPNILNARTETALFIAIARKKDSEIIRLLLLNAAKPNIPEHYFGNTSLHRAFYGNNDIIILLLEFGANPHLKDKQGKTVFDIAKENNCVEFPQLVRKYAQNTLTKICLLHILNNLSLYEGKLDILPAKLRDKINSLRN